ncbi:hypothetical protein QMK17_15055 [Rhodococcus sp. G-MC3]|uniref:hypothetical protein n=1 Tax=Rhodococcus sp. G-MC3 TaxID=3046209 RepID=UPI0024BA5D92|nr:hypothetical protein [Rhodococcus sp. G-MC3]MDJ0394641.1 hypothetical protein [Rhodococcus sp. G-MC3]
MPDRENTPGPDKENTTGPRWIKTAENRSGVVLMMAGIVAAALFITALAGGFEGWVWIAAGATVVLVVGGFLSLRAGARRAVEQRPIVYHPDSPDVAIDIDPDTGKRSPHRD